MILLGQTQTLPIARVTSVGAFLTDGQKDVLLPNKYMPERANPGDEVTVFVYMDSSDRPIATTLKPKAEVGGFATMKVVSVSNIGAFMDWGLEKDLLVPFAAQLRPLAEGRYAAVWVELDEISGRIIGSTKFRRHLKADATGLPVAQPVKLVILDEAPDGLVVGIDGYYHGMLFTDEIIGRPRIGDQMNGYVKKVREDGRVCVALNPQGQNAIVGEAPTLLARLDKAGGYLPYSDSTDPAVIRREFSMSKSAFKRLIGHLLREGQIEIEHHGIRRKKP